MSTVNMLEAKTHLSRLVEKIEKGQESEIIIARNGRPVARLAPLETGEGKRKLRPGLQAGKFPPLSVEDFDASNALIQKMFEGDAE